MKPFCVSKAGVQWGGHKGHSPSIAALAVISKYSTASSVHTVVNT